MRLCPETQGVRRIFHEVLVLLGFHPETQGVRVPKNLWNRRQCVSPRNPGGAGCRKTCARSTPKSVWMFFQRRGFASCMYDFSVVRGLFWRAGTIWTRLRHGFHVKIAYVGNMPESAFSPRKRDTLGYRDARCRPAPLESLWVPCLFCMFHVK